MLVSHVNYKIITNYVSFLVEFSICLNGILYLVVYVFSLCSEISLQYNFIYDIIPGHFLIGQNVAVCLLRYNYRTILPVFSRIIADGIR